MAVVDSWPQARRQARAIIDRDRFWYVLIALVLTALYLSTLQWTINGSEHAYGTDVGEIQNALPRWGTIHYPGYPLYSLIGSSFVTVLRVVGVEPAAGASLFSVVWGVVTALLLFALAQELGVRPLPAALGTLVAALSTSLWIDASLAEVYTMGTALFVATLYTALRLGRHGQRRDLLWLVLVFSQGLAHQRTKLFLLPAVLLLIWPQRKEIWHHWPEALGLTALAPLTYLYLPIRAWQGAAWLFGDVGTMPGLLSIVLDTKVDRVIDLPAGWAGWLERGNMLAGLLHDDLWLPILALGLIGLWLWPWRRKAWREPLALTLAWLPSVALSLAIWEGYISAALLAAKLPVVLMAGLGLALLVDRPGRRGVLAIGALAIAATVMIPVNRPHVLAITRDQGAQRWIDQAAQVAPPLDESPTTFMALWGHAYWALAYAQAYNGQLPGLTIVDHNADLAAIAARGERLLTFSDTLYQRPLEWWDALLDGAHLSSPAPGIVEISPIAQRDDGTEEELLTLENGVSVLSATLWPTEDDELVLSVIWRADQSLDEDYAVAVHLLAQEQPQGPGDILAQADRENPVDGWYPTSHWTPGELVHDTYLLSIPPEHAPQAVRIGMYRVTDDGQFENAGWLTLELSRDLSIGFLPLWRRVPSIGNS
jgi:hypothetical protein